MDATTMPPVGGAIPREDPVAKCERLFRELSEALNHAWGGEFGCNVYPARLGPLVRGGAFFDLKSDAVVYRHTRRAWKYTDRLFGLTPEQRVRHHSKRLAAGLRALHPGKWAGQLYCDDRGQPFAFSMAMAGAQVTVGSQS